jgi:hypothetical protein
MNRYCHIKTDTWNNTIAKMPTTETISVTFTLQSNIHSFSVLSSHAILLAFEPAFVWGFYAKIQLKCNQPLKT